MVLAVGGSNGHRRLDHKVHVQLTTTDHARRKLVTIKFKRVVSVLTFCVTLETFLSYSRTSLIRISCIEENLFRISRNEV